MLRKQPAGVSHTQKHGLILAYDVIGVLEMPAIDVFEPGSFLRLEGFSQHPVRQDRVRYDGEENLLW
jgi:hypothetical protein